MRVTQLRIKNIITWDVNYDDFRINNDSQLFFYAQKMDQQVYDYREELTMSFFYPPITEKRYVDCVICKRFVSVGHTELLFMDVRKEVRVCGWCNHA